MRIPLHITTFATIALLVTPHAAPSGSPHGEVEIEALEVQAGGETTGGLVALFIDHFFEGNPLPDSPAFHLESPSASIVSHHAPAKASTLDMGAQRIRMHDGPATLEGVEARPGLHLLITPLESAETPAVHMEHPACTNLEPPRRSSLTREPMVNKSRPDLVVSTNQSVHASSCTEAQLIIEGDVSVLLWEWDVDLNGERITTGVHDDAPGTGVNTGTGVGSADELEIRALNATLRIPLTPGTYTFHLDQTELMAHNLRLANAEGVLPGVLEPAHGEDVELSGDYTVTVTPQGIQQPLSASLAGTTQSATADGRTLSVPIPSTPGAQSPAVLAWAGILAVLGFVVAVRFGRPLVLEWYSPRTYGQAPTGLSSRLSLGLALMAESDLERGRLRRAVWRCKRARHWNPNNPGASFVLGGALMALDRLGESQEAYRHAHQYATTTKWRCFSLVGSAEVLAHAGQTGEAAQALLAARAEDAHWAAQAVQGSIWDRFEHQGLLALVRSGLSPGSNSDYHA